MKTFFKKYFFVSLITCILSLSFLPSSLYSQDGGNPGAGGGNPGGGSSYPIKIANPFKQSSITDLITIIIKEILMPIGAVIAVLMIMYAGFMYVTAQGNSTKITEATKALKYAVIGSAILIGAWTISEAIRATVGQLRV